MLKKVYVTYAKANRCLELNVDTRKTVGDVKKLVQKYFMIDTSNMVGAKSIKQIVLEYPKLKCELNDDWLLDDLYIPSGSVLKCRIVEHKNPIFEVYLRYADGRERVKIYEDECELDLLACYVLEIRIWLSGRFGLPLTAFRLKMTQPQASDLYDERLLSDYFSGYGMGTASVLFYMETWQAWDQLLRYAIKGFTTKVTECLSTDEFIKQYQMQATLYVAAFYGHANLADTLINMGARCDRPVGEMDYSSLKKSTTSVNERLAYLKLEYLKCPLHVAIENGQLRIVTHMVQREGAHILHQPDGYGLTPLRVSLRNRHTTNEAKRNGQREVARYLMTQHFSGRVKLPNTTTITTTTTATSEIGGKQQQPLQPVVVTISAKIVYKIKCWLERARERVLYVHGIGKSSMPKKRIQMRTGLVGNMVLVDGFNNNFRDYAHSYERLRPKYKWYYYMSEEDRNRNGIPEFYFRTIGLFRPRESSTRWGSKRGGGISSAHSDALSRSFRSGVGSGVSSGRGGADTRLSMKSNPKCVERWRSIINKVMSLRVKVKCYKIFYNLGVRVSFDGVNMAEISYFSADWKEIKNFNQLKEEQSRAMVERNQQQTRKKSSLSTPQEDLLFERMSSTSMPSYHRSDEIFSASVTYFEEQFKRARKQNEIKRRMSHTAPTAARRGGAAALPVMSKKAHTASTTRLLVRNPDPLGSTVKSRRDRFIRSVMSEYRSVCRSSENDDGGDGDGDKNVADNNEPAEKLFDEVTRLSRSKSWLGRVDFGARIATARVRRSFYGNNDEIRQRRVQTAKI